MFGFFNWNHMEFIGYLGRMGSFVMSFPIWEMGSMSFCSFQSFCVSIRVRVFLTCVLHFSLHLSLGCCRFRCCCDNWYLFCNISSPVTAGMLEVLWFLSDALWCRLWAPAAPCSLSPQVRCLYLRSDTLGTGEFLGGEVLILLTFIPWYLAQSLGCSKSF